jgi:hypothetical protein
MVPMLTTPTLAPVACGNCAHWECDSPTGRLGYCEALDDRTKIWDACHDFEERP